MCYGCWYDRDYKKRVDSANNIRKLMTGSRTGNLDQNSTQIKGAMFQELTCEWRSMVSTVLVEDLNKKLDNYTTPIDHSPDSELGIIQTKGKLYDSVSMMWSQNWHREHNKEFDNVIYYCASEDGDLIEEIYIFPRHEVLKRSGVAIVKYNSIGKIYRRGWYEKYRVKDKETLEMVNEIWRGIIKRNVARKKVIMEK
jgi:hypothetical protein